MPTVTPRCESIQYDGTNGAYIINEWSRRRRLISDDGETLVIADDEDNETTVQRGAWFVRTADRGIYDVLPNDAAYRRAWAEIPESAGTAN